MKNIIKLVTLVVGLSSLSGSAFTASAEEIKPANEISVPVETDFEQKTNEAEEEVVENATETQDVLEEVQETEVPEIVVEETVEENPKEEIEEVVEENTVGNESDVTEEPTEEIEEDVETDGSDLIEPQSQPVFQTMMQKLQYDQIFHSVKVNYFAQVRSKNAGIYTQPKGTKNAILYTTYKFNWKDVLAVEEATTNSGVFAKLVSVDNGHVIGWINKIDLARYNSIESSYPVQYYGIINSSNTGIYTQPKGTYGAILYTSYKYNSKAVRVIEEAVTSQGTFIKVESIDENRVLGWIYKDDVSTMDDFFTNRVPIKKFAVVNSANQGIYTAPQGAFGSILYTSYKFNNKAVKVVEEAETLTEKYSLLQRIEDSSVIGWIRSNEITETNFIKSSSSASFYGKVSPNNTGIYTRPYGDFDAILYTSYKYNNKDVRVIEEANTLNGSYSKISDVTDGRVLGWIESKFISKYEDIKNVSPVNLFGIVKPNNDGIYTKPKGMQGAILYTTYKMNNKDVHVVEQARTASGDFYKLAGVGNGTTIGWIRTSDVNLYDTVQSTRVVDYVAKVSSKNQGIYTSPKGTYGAVLYTTYLFNNKNVKVIEESVTPSGTFAKLARVENNTFIGWINKDDLLTSKTVFIDVGHGGSDPGAQYYGVNEKDINLQVSNKLKQKLEQAGYTVIMPRSSDIHIDYKTERSKMANASNADIFVSVHHNAMPGNAGVNGIETFYYKYDPDYPSKINGAMHNDPTRVLKSAALANEIHKALINSTAAYNRGVRRNSFAVLRETNIPAVLLELGFMSNQNELNKLTTSSYQEVLSSAVKAGIDAYFNQHN